MVVPVLYIRSYAIDTYLSAVVRAYMTILGNLAFACCVHKYCTGGCNFKYSYRYTVNLMAPAVKKI